MVHAAVQEQPTVDIRRSSTSSESSTSSNVDQIQPPILVRYNNMDFPINRGNSIKKSVRIDEPVSSESSETEYSSEAGMQLSTFITRLAFLTGLQFARLFPKVFFMFALPWRTSF